MPVGNSGAVSIRPEQGCGREPCERRDGGRLKNVAERGDRGVGDRDPRRASLDGHLGATFFRAVERARRAAVFWPRFVAPNFRRALR